MNRLSNKKKLAEIKDSLDALEEKYGFEGNGVFNHHSYNQEDSSETITQKGSFRDVVNEYLQKLTSKKKVKTDGNKITVDKTNLDI